MELIPTFPTPCRMPNGLQWTDEGLFVMDQYTDNVYVLDEDGRVARTVASVTENGSGITVGGGFLWTASNGVTISRPYRVTDTHLPWIYKLDLDTGEAIDRLPIPEGDGVHGIEWDDGLLWATFFNPRAIVLMDPANGAVVKKFLVDIDVLHGLARDGDGIWCAERREKIIVKYHVETGEEMDRITFPRDGPNPHGVSIKDGELWYSDAAFPPEDAREAPEIGRIVR